MILNVWYSIHVTKQARCGRGESDLRERLCKYASTRSACSHKQDLFHLISYWNHFLQLQIPFNKPAYFKEIVKYKLKYVMIFTFRKSWYIYIKCIRLELRSYWYSVSFRSWVITVKFTVTHIIKKLSAFIELEGSALCSHKSLLPWISWIQCTHIH
jgi:hypothetical protein